MSEDKFHLFDDFTLDLNAPAPYCVPMRPAPQTHEVPKYLVEHRG